MDTRDNEQEELCRQIIDLASKLKDNDARLIIMSRANDLQQWIKRKNDPPELI